MNLAAFPRILISRHYTADGHRYKVNPKKHLLHSAGDTPALDARAVRWWSDHGVQTVFVHLTDGRVMEADLCLFVAGARTFEYIGHGTQMVNRHAWVIRDARQTRLGDPIATN